MSAKIQPTGDRYCYRVESISRPGQTHLVDLTGNKGAGKCTCLDHACRRQPAIDRGEPILTQATLCRHLRAAYWHFLREVMPAMAEAEDGKE